MMFHVNINATEHAAELYVIRLIDWGNAKYVKNTKEIE